MDSINKNQPEDNYKDLDAAEAIEKIKAIGDKIKTCFFSTFSPEGRPENTRPMSVQQVDDEGVIWFMSASDSKKNYEINQNSEVHLYFQGSAYTDFAVLQGHAEISEDKQKIHDLWGPLLKTWFTEGVDDPRITLIAISPSHGYYWDTKHGKLVAFAKQIAGAIMGKTLDDSIEGKINAPQNRG